MTEAQLSTTIIENPEMLKYQQRQQQAEQKNEALRDVAGSAAAAAAAAPKVASMVNGESLEDIRKVHVLGGGLREGLNYMCSQAFVTPSSTLLQQQVESRMGLPSRRLSLPIITPPPANTHPHLHFALSVVDQMWFCICASRYLVERSCGYGR